MFARIGPVRPRRLHVAIAEVLKFDGLVWPISPVAAATASRYLRSHSVDACM